MSFELVGSLIYFDIQLNNIINIFGIYTHGYLKRYDEINKYVLQENPLAYNFQGTWIGSISGSFVWAFLIIFWGKRDEKTIVQFKS